MKFSFLPFITYPDKGESNSKVMLETSKDDYLSLKQFIESLPLDSSFGTFKERLQNVLFGHLQDVTYLDSNHTVPEVSFPASSSSELLGVAINLVMMLKTSMLEIEDLHQKHQQEMDELKEKMSYDVSLAAQNSEQVEARLKEETERLSNNLVSMHVNALKQYRKTIEDENAELKASFDKRIAEVEEQYKTKLEQLARDKDIVINGLKEQSSKDHKLISLLIKKHDMYIENQKRLSEYDELESHISDLVDDL